MMYLNFDIDILAPFCLNLTFSKAWNGPQHQIRKLIPVLNYTDPWESDESLVAWSRSKG